MEKGFLARKKWDCTVALSNENRFVSEIEDLVENFEYLEDWEDRYRYIIEMGDKVESLPEKYKTDQYKVNGCLSQVWFTARKENEKFIFIADSDAKIVKGLIAVLLLIYNHKTKEEIQNINLEDYFKRLGLEGHISMNRRNGFFAMVERIKKLAGSEHDESASTNTKNISSY